MSAVIQALINLIFASVITFGHVQSFAVHKRVNHSQNSPEGDDLKTLWKMNKLLVINIDSFSHSVSYLNENYLLTLSEMTNFRLFQTERVCRRQFQV